MLNMPEGLIEIEEGMSNCDHTIDDGCAEKLKSGKYCCGYAGWDFHGMVWWDGELFQCRVKRYRVHVATIGEPTLGELMESVSDEFGYA